MDESSNATASAPARSKTGRKKSGGKAGFTAADKVSALQREINRRRAVYPTKIGRGMTPERARRDIAVMEAVLRDHLCCFVCRKTTADYHDPEPIAGNVQGRKAVRLVEAEGLGLYICTKCQRARAGTPS